MVENNISNDTIFAIVLGVLIVIFLIIIIVLATCVNGFKNIYTYNNIPGAGLFLNIQGLTLPKMNIYKEEASSEEVSSGEVSSNEVITERIPYRGIGQSLLLDQLYINENMNMNNKFILKSAIKNTDKKEEESIYDMNKRLNNISNAGFITETN